jgi:hypothetical protein
MLGYGKTIRRLRADSDMVVIPPLRGYDLCVNFNKCKQKYDRKIGQMLKFAACFVLVTVLFGLAVIPSNIMPQQSSTNADVSGGNAAVAHSFTLAAYAAETSTASNAPDAATSAPNIDEASKTLLKPDIKVQLPAGKWVKDNLDHDNTNVNPNWYDKSGVKHYCAYTFEGGSFFTCEGDNIESVNYTTLNGYLSYYNDDEQHKVTEEGKAFICNLVVPGSVANGSSDDLIDNTFMELAQSGKLDDYNDKLVDIGNGCQISFRFGDYGGMFVVSGVNMAYGDATSQRIHPSGISVTAKPDVNVSWLPSEAIWNTVDTNPNFTDYASLPPDTVTVTAKFTDGQTLTKTVVISYNADGSISATLQGN